jgi:hypothetical protein
MIARPAIAGGDPLDAPALLQPADVQIQPQTDLSVSPE